ncbi:ANTAR domain-containing protein [Nocardioides scoriae]|uniref:ANTAR domain-containing protein n=1 Tax=Nocardioides scoriae TaxID=642780 RepID=A0A1H1UYZ6_9ACTN|nr:ANTAR domain-containing protein [Nocardioides scoriae]SDS77742.1 ANTAR domain-containing protein [Nocardioides scoriae]
MHEQYAGWVERELSRIARALEREAARAETVDEGSAATVLAAALGRARREVALLEATVADLPDVEAAVGALVDRYDLDVAAAFSTIASASANFGQGLGEVSRRVLESSRSASVTCGRGPGRDDGPEE